MQDEELEFVENLVFRHTNTVDKWLKKGKTIAEAYAEANREAMKSITAKYISKDKLLKTRPALQPVDWNDISTPDLIAKQSEAYGRNEALKDWSKALGIGETE